MIAVHQVVSTFEHRDAVGNEVAAIGDGLRRRGYESEVFTVLQRRGDRPSRPLEDLIDGPRPDAVVYHFAIASEATRRLVDWDVPLVVVHHNVTPAHFFWGIDWDHHEGCRAAAEEALSLRDRAALVVAHSRFTRDEVARAGFPRTVVVPLVVGLEADGAPPATDLPPANGPVLLTVGRVAPNKRLDDVIRLLHTYRRGVDPTATLWIVGAGDRLPAYRAALERLVDDLRERDSVHWLGSVDDATLAACFRHGRVYVSMSEHEGFGGPLVQAMRAGLPVLAFDAGAVAETLGGAGILLRRKHLRAAAELLDRLVRDGPARAAAVGRGTRRVADLAGDRSLDALVGHLSAAGVPSP